jgi:hypothetical protein
MSITKYLFKESHPSEVKSGFSVTFHDPFEVISKSSPTFNTIPNQTIVLWIIPSLLTYDDSILDFSPKE